MFTAMLLSDLTPDQVEMMTDLRLAGASLLIIVNDILDMSKLESDQILTLVNAPFRVSEVVDGIYTLMKHQTMSMNIGFDIDIAEIVPTFLTGDAQRIKQILFNLISNAVKYTTSRSIAVTVDGSLCSDDEFNLIVRVVDTGCGIAADETEEIFSAFTQVRGSKAGTGLGLYISRKLAEMMRGDITCESVLGEGSVFTLDVTLPVDTQATNSSTIQDFSAADIGSCPYDIRVMIAEDNPLNLTVARRLLAKLLSRQPDIAIDGEEAVALARQNDYDLIFMDVNMPNTNGLEATRQIRQFSTDNRPVVVAMTANAMQGDREICLDAGCDDYVSKPVAVSTLQDVLEKWF